MTDLDREVYDFIDLSHCLYFIIELGKSWDNKLLKSTLELYIIVLGTNNFILDYFNYFKWIEIQGNNWQLSCVHLRKG